MKFRPCIDIHNGKVKQIVGGSLKDEAIWHRPILLQNRMQPGMQKNINRMDSKAGISFCSTPEIPNILRQRKNRRSWRFRHIREGCRSAAVSTAENAEEYLDAGASHVIVTSYIFREGEVESQPFETTERYGSEKRE